GLLLVLLTAAMHLHGGFGNDAIARDPFATAVGPVLNHDLALPGAQRLEAFPEAGSVFVVVAASAIVTEAERDAVGELRITERLGKQPNGTTLNRLHRDGEVDVPCDEDDWECPVRRGELALKIKTAMPRQPDVEDQAGGAIRQTGLEKVGNGRK